MHRLGRAYVVLSLLLLAALAASQSPQSDPIMQALSHKRFDVALQAIDTALKTRPTDARLWMLRGAALGGLRQTKESLAAYRKATQLQPNLMPALQAEAQLEYSIKDPTARRTLGKILALDPKSEVAHAMAGVLAYEAQDCDGAVQHMDKAAKLVAARRTSLEEYGYCLLQVNRPHDAAPVFQTLLSTDDTDTRVRLNLVLSLAAANQPAQAIEVLTPLATVATPDADVLGLLAELYRSNDQVDKAIAAFRRGIEIYPKEERLYIGLAALCSYYNSGELGLEIVQIALKNIPSSSRLYAMRGVLNSQMGKEEESMADFARASDLSPVEQVGKTGVALSLMQEGRLDEVIQLAREQLEKSPDDASSHFLLAQALLRKGARPGDGTFAEAGTALERSVRIEPKFDQARALLGKLYLDQKKYDPAIKELEAALNLRPANRVAMYQLMLAYQAAGRSRDAARIQEQLKATMEKERQEELQRNKIRLMKVPEQ
jgi:tetratricopeptide (TPR) repeat protein